MHYGKRVNFKTIKINIFYRKNFCLIGLFVPEGLLDTQRTVILKQRQQLYILQRQPETEKLKKIYIRNINLIQC